MIRRLASLALAGLIAVCATAHAAPRTGMTLTVFAAASLTEALRDVRQRFEHDHPGVSLRMNLAGSQQLATQIEQGAPADVFASADERWMEYLRSRGMLLDDPVVFARNRLVVVVPHGNPARIRRLQDLARRGVKLVIGAEAVPVGAYGRQMLQNLAARPEFGPGYARRVLANVVSEEENVKSVLGKVQLGEADAGIVYRSDVTPALSRLVRTLEVPEPANVIANDPIAVLKGSGQPDLGRELVQMLLAPEGQKILAAHNLIPVATTAP